MNCGSKTRLASNEMVVLSFICVLKRRDIRRVQPLAPDPIPGAEGWDMCRVTIDDPYLRAQDYRCNMIPELGRKHISAKVFYLGSRLRCPSAPTLGLLAVVKQSAIEWLHPRFVRETCEIVLRYHVRTEWNPLTIESTCGVVSDLMRWLCVIRSRTKTASYVFISYSHKSVRTWHFPSSHPTIGSMEDRRPLRLTEQVKAAG